MPIDYPIDNTSKSAIEEANFLQLKARQFKGGLPVLTVAPTYEGVQGEMVLYISGATIRVYYYINGTWRYANLT